MNIFYFFIFYWYAVFLFHSDSVILSESRSIFWILKRIETSHAGVEISTLFLPCEWTCLGWNWHFLLWLHCSGCLVSSGSVMHPITRHADARSNYSNCEEEAASYPSPSSWRWKDEMRRRGSAWKRTGVHGKKVILSRIYCASVIHLSQRPPTYGLPSPARISPARVSTLLYLIQSRLYSAGWLRVKGDLARLCLSAGLQELRTATRNKRRLRETGWINLAGSLESDYFNPLRVLSTLLRIYNIHERGG